MGEVKTTFTGDDRDIQAAYDRMYKRQVQLEEQLAKLKSAHNAAGEEAKKYGEHLEPIFNHVGKQIEEARNRLINFVLGFGTVEYAIEKVTSATEKWQEKQRSLAEGAKSVEEGILRQLAAANQLADAREFEKFIVSGLGDSTTRAQALAAFAGINQGFPAASMERKQALIKAVAGYGVVLGGPEEQQAFAEQAAQVSSLSPQFGADEAASRAYRLRQQLSAEQMQTLIGSKQLGAARRLVVSGALSADEALALAVQANQQDQPRLLAELAEKSTQFIARPQTHGRTALTADEAGKLRLSSATPAERLRLLLSGGVTGELAINPDQLALLDPAARTRLQEQIAAPGAREQLERELRSSSLGVRAIQAEEFAVREERYRIKREPTAMRYEEALRALKDQSRSLGDESDWAQAFNERYYRWYQTWFGSDEHPEFALGAPARRLYEQRMGAQQAADASNRDIIRAIERSSAPPPPAQIERQVEK